MILLTGATGIVGSHILKQLIDRGEKVKVLVRGTSNWNVVERVLSAGPSSESLVERVEGDILDPTCITEAIKGCHTVYHCAALVSFDQKRAAEMHLINVQGTANIVNACLENDIRTLCYISSTAAIGDQRIDGYLTEESAWTSDKGRSAYSLSKRSAEFEVHRGREEGLNAVIVNPAVVIGAGEWGKSSTSLIMSCEKGMRLYPPGGNGFVAAQDVARFSIDSVHNQNVQGRYLLVGENLSFKNLFEMITTEFESPKPKVAVPKWALSIAQSTLQFFETVGLNIFSLSSENMASAKRSVRYSNVKSIALGFEYTPIKTAIIETVSAYKATR